MQRFQARITAPLPEGWFAKESITLLAPDGQANVIASSEPLAPDIDVHQYAEVQGDLLRKEFPGYREMWYGARTLFGDRQGYLRRFEWIPPDGAPVTQIQMYYVENERGYTATATTPSTEYRRYAQQLLQILDGLLI